MAPVFCGAAILGLALMPFGQETSYGTFGLLLVQPEERRRFWRIKAGLLAMAMASAWVVFALCIWIHPIDARRMATDLPELLKISALMMFLAFSGGLWSDSVVARHGIRFLLHFDSSGGNMRRDSSRGKPLG